MEEVWGKLELLVIVRVQRPNDSDVYNNINVHARMLVTLLK